MFPWAVVSYLKVFFHISGKFAEILKPEVDSAVQMIQLRRKKSGIPGSLLGPLVNWQVDSAVSITQPSPDFWGSMTLLGDDSTLSLTWLSHGSRLNIKINFQWPSGVNGTTELLTPLSYDSAVFLANWIANISANSSSFYVVNQRPRRNCLVKKPELEYLVGLSL